MRNQRLSAFALGLAGLLVGIVLFRLVDSAFGLWPLVAGIVMMAQTAWRPTSRASRRRLTLTFPAYGLVTGVLGVVALLGISIGGGIALWLISALSFVGWVFARRRSRTQQKAIMYMGYIRD